MLRRVAVSVVVLVGTATVSACTGHRAQGVISAEAPTVAVPPTVTVPAHTSVTEPLTGAVEVKPTVEDIAQVGAAYATWTMFSGCSVRPLPATLKAAVISATGVEWAFGRFEPASHCSVSVDGRPVDARTVYPFDAGRANASGVFEKQPGRAWVMNDFESQPFPCPDNPGLPNGEGTPGYDTPFVPRAVLHAMDVGYATSGCDTAYTPPAPQ